jgi:hypothetical protein
MIWILILIIAAVTVTPSVCLWFLKPAGAPGFEEAAPQSEIDGAIARLQWPPKRRMRKKR